GGEDEPVELDLAHGPVPGVGESDSGAEDAGFREWGIYHSVGPERIEEALGDAEDSAQGGDVLPHEEDLVIALHRAAQAGVDCPAEGERVGATHAVSSKPAWYASNHSRSEVTCGCSEAYTWSNIVSGAGVGRLRQCSRVRTPSSSAASSTPAK